MEEALPVAASIGLLPQDFFVLTPKEFSLVLAGHDMRDKSVWAKLATVTAHLMAPHYKRGRGPSPKKLFDAWTKPARTRPLSEAEKAEALKEKLDYLKRKHIMEKLRKGVQR